MKSSRFMRISFDGLSVIMAVVAKVFSGAGLMMTTERTCIRPIELVDAPFFLELTNSPGWLEYIGDRDVHSVEDAEGILQNGMLRSVVEHGFGYQLVASKAGVSMGVCGFLKKEYLENPDFGFAFLPEFGGQGYAYESTKAILAFGIQEFGFSALDAVSMPSNIKSNRLLEKLGFGVIGNLPLNNDVQGLQLHRLETKDNLEP